MARACGIRTVADDAVFWGPPGSCTPPHQPWNTTLGLGGDTCPCKILSPTALFPLHPTEGKNWWCVKVKYKLSLIFLVSMTQVKMMP